VEPQPSWGCGACGEPIGGEAALREHQEWCVGDAAANRRLLEQVSREVGGLDQETLVETAGQYRLAREEANPPDD